MVKEDVMVTVFTPTYNRADKISNLYKSLSQQTCFNFEWLIVDDGQDETESIVDGFIRKEKKFMIRYFNRKGKERGIGRALNFAIEKAEGELFFKVDDDDELSEDAIQKIICYYKLLPREGFAGLSFMRAHKDNTIIGESANLSSGEYVDCTSLQRKEYKLCGDKAEVYFTKVLRMYYPIPTIPGEYYTWEAVLWNKIAHNGYKIRWYGDVIYYTEYLEGGATAGESRARYDNFKTYTLLIRQVVEYEEFTWLDKIKHLCRYFEIARKKKMRYVEFKDEFISHRCLKRLCWNASVITRVI